MKKESESKSFLLESALKEFEKKIGSTKDALIFLSPASIVFLGDHTHYSDGLIFNATIDRFAAVIIKENNSKGVNLYYDSQKVEIVDISQVHIENSIIRGIIKLIQNLLAKRVLDSSFDCVIHTNFLPMLGVARNSAVLVGLMKALNSLFHWDMNNDEIIKHTREAELDTISKISNIANHYASIYSKEDKLMFLDIRTNEFEYYSLNSDKYKIIICDTGLTIDCPEVLCNERISECEVGVKGLRLYVWGIKNIRDVSLSFLEKHIHMIPRRVYKRIYYTVNERLRADRAREEIKRGSIKGFGDQMYLSHRGLFENYELSCEELNYIVSETKSIPGVYGSKMISCSGYYSSINLVSENKAASFIETISQKYKEKFNRKLSAYLLNINGGIEEKRID
ncbi:MAG: hypothetical protein K9J16_17620 [Melioribacteraceae bacterium]|nr:hypothetical protein [Melioribacteraceae bacterium]MCF8354899.1 hypothetical protein [Melioribacteraceae bacterium]MCF8396044.1 hypothetical protein [Melioribacteraceae bacterium]MCF8421065.1 hypothetical protein [Melioribacteraceae bacterium]